MGLPELSASVTAVSGAFVSAAALLYSPDTTLPMAPTIPTPTPAAAYAIGLTLSSIDSCSTVVILSLVVLVAVLVLSPLTSLSYLTLPFFSSLTPSFGESFAALSYLLTIISVSASSISALAVASL